MVFLYTTHEHINLECVGFIIGHCLQLCIHTRDKYYFILHEGPNRYLFSARFGGWFPLDGVVIVPYSVLLHSNAYNVTLLDVSSIYIEIM